MMHREGDRLLHQPPHQFALWQCPDSARESKKLLTCNASSDDRRNSPSSMFRACAASVKFADETKSSEPSTTTHLACRTACFFGSDGNLSAGALRKTPCLRYGGKA